MKRKSCLLFGIILVFALTSCGGGFSFLPRTETSAPTAGISQNTTDTGTAPISFPSTPARVSPEALPPICSCVLRFDHINIEEGLSQSSVRVIFQDSHGFLWFGTQDGLNRYDGYTFKVYKPDPDAPNSLSDRYITAIAEDKEGYLWIGTRLGGLNRYDPRTENFTHFLHDDENPSSINHNSINVLYLDKNDNLWIGTPRGIDFYDRVTGDFKHQGFNPLQKWDASKKNITAIYEDSIGRFWFGTSDSGLGRLSSNGSALFFSYQHSSGNANETENEDVVENENTISHNYVTKIIEDANGILWIGTRNGLNRFVPETGEFQRFMHRDRVAESIADNTINDLRLDLTGNLWVATANGLDRLDAESGTFIHYRNDPTFSKSLSDNDVLSIYEDRGGVLWFGTFGGGINKYDRQRDNFAYYRHDPNDPDTLSENFIFSIYVDRDGEAWVGTHSKGLNRLNRSMHQVMRYQNNPADPNSIGSNEKILAIDEDQDGILWIGTANGLDRFDKQTSTFTHFTRDQRRPESLSANFIYSLFVDSQNDVWIGTVSGLDRLNRETGTFTHYYPETENPTSLSGIMVYSITEDQEGNIWVGTFSNGLNKLNRKTNKFTRYRYDPKDKKSLSNDSILSIYEDTKGRLWIGTAGGGLNLYHPESESFSYYLERDGLPNGVVYGILEDDQGMLWLSTNFGISRFDPETETFRNFDSGDGLQSNEFNSGAYAKGKDGELYFGGINGLTVFHPSDIIDSPYLPQVTLTSLTQGDKPIPTHNSIETTPNVTLTWPQNSLEFEFAALSYSQPNKNQYAYILEGFDTNWHFIGTKRDGRYTNLPGGQYTLLLKASNSDGVWSETPVRINVTVIPPFWQTLWFRVLLGVIAVAAVAGGVRLRTKTIQDRNRQLERLVRERTGALEKRNQEIQALYEADERILRNVSLNQVFQTLVDVAVDVLNADRSMVFAWDEKQTKVVPLVSHGFSAETLEVMQFAKGEGLVGEVLATGRPVIVRQIELSDFRPDIRAAIIAEGIRSFVHLPIIVDHKVVAVFNLGFTTPNLIGDDTTRLFSALTNRAAISIANMELFEQTKDLAVMEERNRLARDLHDSAKQKAFAALAQLGTARGLLNGHGNSVTMHLNEAENLVTDVIQELTFLVQEIYPIGLQEKGLVTTLREHIFEWENRNDTIIQFVTHNEQRLPLEIEQAIYRVTQEALANVARHSQAKRVDVSLIYNGDSVQLCISDDGRGFDMNKKHGMGLRSIRERISSIRGTVQIQSAPGHGTRLFVQVPTKG